jgi:endonuclease YncB( thermonuclease family)
MGRVMAYKVTNVIDGDTFEVLPPWKWRDQSGIRVRPTGYNTPEEGQQGYQKAKERLRTLTLIDRNIATIVITAAMNMK